MKLSMNSMLFRSARFQAEFCSEYAFYPAGDLCTFVRRYFVTMLWKSTLLTIVSIFLTSAIMNAVLFLFGNPAGLDNDAFFILGQAVWGLAIIGALAAIVMGLFSLGFHGAEIGTEKLSKTVIGEYIKAKKNRYCPRIEFTK